MDTDKKFKRIIKTIYPGGIDECVIAHHNDRTLFGKLILVSDLIKKPSKNPIILFNQINEGKEYMINLLNQELSSEEAIKDFKNKVKDPSKKYSEEIRLIKECENFNTTPNGKKEIKKYIEKLKKLDNWYDLVELRLNIDRLIPYEIKSLEYKLKHKYYDYLKPEDQDACFGYFAIYNSPLFLLRESISDKIREINNPDITELYENFLSLDDILNIMLGYTDKYAQEKKGIFSWKMFFGIIIIGYIILEALSIIEWNNLFIVPVIIVYIILSGLLDK